MSWAQTLQFILWCQIQYICNWMNPVLDYNIYYNQRLGNGGFASVYKCERQGQYYAVKIYDLELKPKKQKQYMVKALQRQKQILQKLRGLSQNIISFYDYYQENNKYYFFTELCSMSLDDKIYGSPMKEEEGVEYLFQIINGYQQLYQSKIIHRDLKPENILITFDDVIKLADFGVSKYQNNKNTVIGTICYQSPQLLQGSPQYTYKCDIWAIAMTYFEMLHQQLIYKLDNYDNLNDHHILFQYIKQMNIDQLISSTISPASKLFIKQGLAFNECDRISFQEIKKHPIFANKFYARKVMSDLRFTVRLNRIDIRSILKSLKIQPKQVVDMEKLGVFLKMINKSIDAPKIKIIFKNYKDDDKDGIQIYTILDRLIDTESFILKKSENSTLVVKNSQRVSKKFPRRQRIII